MNISHDLKISVITAVCNRADTIAAAVKSVLKQTYPDVEYVIIDGASSDGTLSILKSIAHNLNNILLVSEPDNGIYDALNKGLKYATGDIIGILHSDDYFADEQVLKHVAEAFVDEGVDAVYGDLVYVAKDDTSRIIRLWRAGEYHPSNLARGWMPPHPTLFLRRRVIERWGGYDTRYRISADYDSILRYFGKGLIRTVYIPRVLVKMRLGGESNRSLGRILRKSKEDYLALHRNGIGGLSVLLWKNLSKVGQFF